MAVGRPTLAVSPPNGTKSDLRRSEFKDFPGGHVLHVPHPLARVLRALYAISHVHTGTPLFDPPLRVCHTAAILHAAHGNVQQPAHNLIAV